MSDESRRPASDRIAIVHEWVAAYAGSEQVFEAIAQAFSGADLYALSVDPRVGLDVGGRHIETTFLDRPLLRDHRSLTLPLMPLAWRTLGGHCYDVVISSHHSFAHSNRLANSSGLHLSYVHSPARYIWMPEIDKRGSATFLAPARSGLKWVDRRASNRVVSYAANSRAVADRIEKFWQRPSRVIYPPVRVEFFSQGAESAVTGDYVLGVGRWIGYKNLKAVIHAAEAANLPAVIAGRGPEREALMAAASAARVHVEIVESPSDEELRALYQSARCLVFPTSEDFGIVMVEAQAAGLPVVALAEGGALDIVVAGKTGVLTSDTAPATIAQAIAASSALDRADCIENSKRFSRTRFTAELNAWVRAS